jgi:Holliday junction resolvase-like predicted endonuclease
MATREARVEKYLDQQVRDKLGGITRKWENRHHAGVPDRIVIAHGKVVFVEVKTTDGTLSAIQVREHDRLREAGADVFTAYGKEGVNDLIKEMQS